MQALTILEGLVVPIHRANIDTDAIIPKQYLKSIERTGFGVNLFDDWRYLDPGEPGQDHSKRRINTDFVLNQARYQGASILLTGKNFGCGSSREHAPWALQGYGIRVILAPSYADIFYNNCIKNGILPVTLAEEVIEKLFDAVEGTPGYSLKVDLPAKMLTLPGDSQLADNRQLTFAIDDFRKEQLVKGLDDIGLTLQYRDSIHDYERRRSLQAPWLFQ
ncbi:MAG TPA: 3-isopropylmalate dehydratase small subunit [Gammaproteobacteria bacterium]|nr:3-isopropylmalate dehydratase small subunit [Gammaproteobacteria bacterium]